MLTRGERLGAHVEFGRRDRGVDERDLAVGGCDHDADTVRRNTVRMPEERGARCGGGQRSTPDPLALAAEDGHTEWREDEGQPGRVQGRNCSADEVDDVPDARGLRGSGGCGLACHGLL